MLNWQKLMQSNVIGFLGQIPKLERYLLIRYKSEFVSQRKKISYESTYAWLEGSS